MLTNYVARRDRPLPDITSPGFFITSTTRRIQRRWVRQTFHKLLALADTQITLCGGTTVIARSSDQSQPPRI